MRPTLGEVRMACRLRRPPTDPVVTNCARAEIWRTPGRGSLDPEARRLDAVADVGAMTELVADYAVALAEAIDTDVDVAFWEHALKNAALCGGCSNRSTSPPRPSTTQPPTMGPHRRRP